MSAQWVQGARLLLWQILGSHQLLMTILATVQAGEAWPGIDTQGLHSLDENTEFTNACMLVFSILLIYYNSK